MLGPRGHTAAQLAPARGCRAGRWAPPAVAAGALAPPGWLLCQPELLVLLFQEEVHKQALLPLDLVADVCGDVRDHPVHEDTQEHHQVLGELREGVRGEAPAGGFRPGVGGWW